MKLAQDLSVVSFPLTQPNSILIEPLLVLTACNSRQKTRRLFCKLRLIEPAMGPILLRRALHCFPFVLMHSQGVKTSTIVHRELIRFWAPVAIVIKYLSFTTFSHCLAINQAWHGTALSVIFFFLLYMSVCSPSFFIMVFIFLAPTLHLSLFFPSAKVSYLDLVLP